MGDGLLYAMEFRLRLQQFPPQAGLESGTASLAGWLVVFFLVERPFETLFQSISDRFSERGRKRSEKIEESKCRNNPHSHLLQAQ